MLSKVFTVYDSAVEAYLSPFFLPAKGAAIRAFTELVNDPNHQFGKHPADYVLFELGTYDDAKAEFVLHAAPVSMGVGIEFVRQN